MASNQNKTVEENIRPNNLGGTWLIAANDPLDIFKDVREEKAKLEKMAQMEDNEPKGRMLEAYDRNEPNKPAVNAAQVAVMKRMFGI